MSRHNALGGGAGSGGAEAAGAAHRFGQGIDALERGDLDPLDDQLRDPVPALEVQSLGLVRVQQAQCCIQLVIRRGC